MDVLQRDLCGHTKLTCANNCLCSETISGVVHMRVGTVMELVSHIVDSGTEQSRSFLCWQRQNCVLWYSSQLRQNARSFLSEGVKEYPHRISTPETNASSPPVWMGLKEEKKWRLEGWTPRGFFAASPFVSLLGRRASLRLTNQGLKSKKNEKALKAQTSRLGSHLS